MRPSALFCLIVVYVGCVASSCTRPSASAHLRPETRPVVEPSWADENRNGFPDGVELRSYEDRENFRKWFTAIAELQFYNMSDAWNPDQRDCAGLVRFAMRETLRRHDRLWFRKMGAAYEPVALDVKSLDIDRGRLGGKIFRAGFGSFKESDLKEGLLAEFADARNLKNFNSDFVSRDRRNAEPGDLIFFYQPWVQKFPYHVMIFLGPAREDPDSADDWVVYHTGASAPDEGVVKKVRLSTLDHHPDPRWRPITGNRNFFGFYRLRLLG